MKWIMNKKGAALAWVIVIFAFMTILITSTIVIARQDVIESNWQSDRSDAYYVAISGVELGYATLLSSTGGGLYIEQFKSDSSKIVNDSFVISDGGTNIGTAAVTIKTVNVEGKDWIQIESVGSVLNSTFNNTSSLRIDTTNYDNVVRNAFGD